jgi:predicted ATPase
VVADELTVRAIAPDAVVCDQLEDGIWTVHAVSHRLGAAAEHAGRTPFVGRRNELALLGTLYQSVLEHEYPSMVAVQGHAGVGKSRLIDEFLDGIEPSRPTVYRGRCLAYGEGITYWALREVLWAASQISLADTAADAEAKLRRCVSEVVPAVDADRVAAALAVTAGITLSEDPLAGVAAASVREEISLSWPAFLSGLAAHRPTVVVLEDLHWAEEPLLALIEHLLARSTGSLLLLVSTRPEHGEARHRWPARPDITQIGLQPLPEPHAHELIATLLPAADADLKQHVLTVAEGNPFFAKQLARHPTADNDRSDAIPGGIRTLLAARVDALPAAEKRALQDAAVIGRVFWATAIESIEAQSRLHEALAALEQRGLLITRPSSSLPGHTELSFGHGLVREVAYQSIPRAQRCRAHAAVAAWLEQRAGDRREELIELIAYHYERGATPEDATLAWPQAPSERERLRAKAMAALIEAGEAARRRSSLEQALRYAERAETHARDERERLPALELTARTHHAAARPDGALAAYLAAIDACRALGDREAEVKLRAWAVLASVRYFGAHSTGWQARAVELMNEAVADDAVHDWSFAHAAQLIARWGLRVRAGVDERTVEQAKRDAEHAVAIAETAGPPELLATALECLTWTTLEQGFCEANALGDRLISASLNSPDHFEAHECLVAAALCFGWSGSYERSREIGRDAAARAARLTPDRYLHTAAAQTICLAPTGRFAELGLATDRVVELVREEADRTCGQARVALAGRLLWLFESLEQAALEKGLEVFDQTRPTRYGGAESVAGGIEALRHVIGNERARASIAAVDPGDDKAAAILCLRVELPVLALSDDRAALDAAIARARKLARAACAPPLGRIADWAAAVQLAGKDPALAVTRARRAGTLWRALHGRTPDVRPAAARHGCQRHCRHCRPDGRRARVDGRARERSTGASCGR